MSFDEKDIYIKAISNKIKIPLIFSKLLYNRDLKNEESIHSFFLKKELDNPFLLPNMKKIVDKIEEANDLNKKIVIYGDYDVDGMLSSCLLFLFLKKINANVDIFIPDREDGYGLSNKNIDKIIIEYDGELIITVDNGITAKDCASYCKEKNVDLIITDHHEIVKNKYPHDAYAVLNPKLIEVDSDLKNLAGAGVSYFLVRALNSRIKNKQDLIDYKVLAALATISDMVSLKGNNRLIVKEGIELLFETNLAGLNVLVDSLNFFYYPNSNDLAYNLIPILNSAARMNKTEITLNLLTENNLLSYKHSQDLKKLNEVRKQESARFYELAYESVKKNTLNNNYIFLINKEFKSGFIGLISNKISEEFNKPSIIGCEDGEQIRCSARKGKSDVNLVDLINFLEKDLIDGGGHASAIGFSFKKEKLKLIEEKINTFFKNKETKNIKDFHEEELDFSLFNINEFCKFLYKMEPFGISNPAPIIKIKDIKITDFTEIKYLKNNKHLKLKLGSNFELYHFFLSKKELLLYKEKMGNNKENITINVELFSKGYKLVGYIQSFE